MSSHLTKPRLLADTDNLSSFASTNQEMNDWLQKHAWNNQSSGASKTYIIATTEGQEEPNPQQLKALKALLERPAPWD